MTSTYSVGHDDISIKDDKDNISLPTPISNVNGHSSNNVQPIQHTSAAIPKPVSSSAIEPDGVNPTATAPAPASDPSRSTTNLTSNAIAGPSNSNSNTDINGHSEDNGDSNPASPTGWEKEIINKKRKWSLLGFDEDEQKVLEKSSTDLNLAILLDQSSTLYPPPPTRFKSYEDVVDRLLPYHIWQIYDDELDLGMDYHSASASASGNGSGSGTSKGKEKERMREERERQDAEDLVGRIRNVQERFAKTRRRYDETSHYPSLISQLTQSTLELREQLSSVQATLRSTRMEYNALQAEAKKKEDEEARARAALLPKPSPAPALAPTLTSTPTPSRGPTPTLLANAVNSVPVPAPAPAPIPTPTQTSVGRAVPTSLPAPNAASTSISTSTSIKTPITSHASASSPAPPPFAAVATTAAPQSAIAATATPASAAAAPPMLTPTATATDTPERRPRGRPRGRGRGNNLQQTVFSHLQTPTSTSSPSSTTNANVTPSTPVLSSSAAMINPDVKKTANTPTPVRPPTTPASAAGSAQRQVTAPSTSASASSSSATPGTAVGARASPLPGGTPGPVSITVNVALIPQLVALGVLAVPPNPATGNATTSSTPHAPAKTPATIVRASEDKKGVVLSINLGMCSKTQLLGLAKVLNVSAKPPGTTS